MCPLFDTKKFGKPSYKTLLTSKFFINTIVKFSLLAKKLQMFNAKDDQLVSASYVTSEIIFIFCFKLKLSELFLIRLGVHKNNKF